MVVLGIGNNALFVAKLERMRIVERERRIAEGEDIAIEELKKRCVLSTKKYLLAGSDKAKKIRAEALSRDLRRWLV